jgi:hypothetical protein
MYRGFNIEELDWSKDDNYFKQLSQLGEDIFQNYSINAKSTLENFIGSGSGVLNGSKIQDFWFPQMSADIFISHSHNDIDMAKALSGWLSDRFGLRAFVDACVWQHSNTLLKQIDNKYCLLDSGDLYDYHKRNHSTSHVHIMLSTALAMMIDKTECLFFLNTPKSIQSYRDADKTESPWIYSELAISQVIKKHLPKRYLPQGLSDGDKIFEEKKLKLTYDAD